MRESRDHRVIGGQVRGRVRLQNRPSEFQHVGLAVRIGTVATRIDLAKDRRDYFERVTVRIEFRMQREVERREPDLTHLGVCAAKVAGAVHLREQIVRDRFACLVVPGEQVQGLALPAPVLHDLRRELDPVPRDVRAGQALDFDSAQQVVQQVSELVEDRLDLAMRQQGRAARRRRRQVAAIQA